MMSEDININEQAVTDDDRLWGLLSYLLNPIIPLIILFSEDRKNNPFLRYHAVMALGLGVIVTVASLIVIGVCLAPFVGIYAIYLGIKAFQGEMVEVPFLTNFAKEQGWITQE